MTLAVETTEDGYRYLRGNGRWAKISGGSRRWYVAKGYAGEIKARQVLTAPTLTLARAIANGWVNDQIKEA